MGIQRDFIRPDRDSLRAEQPPRRDIMLVVVNLVPMLVVVAFFYGVVQAVMHTLSTVSIP